MNPGNPLYDPVSSAGRDAMLYHDKDGRSFLYSILMHIPAIVCVLRGAEFVFELANEPCRKLTGYRKLEGVKLTEAFPEISGQGFVELLTKVYSTGEAFSGKEAPVVLTKNDKEKETFYLDFTYQPLSDADGLTEAILVFAYDVTEQVLSRNRIRDKESWYHDLIQGLPYAVYTCDAQGYILTYNQAAADLWGREPLAGKTLGCGAYRTYTISRKLLSEEDLPVLRALQKGILSNDKLIIERPDGTQRIVISYPKIIYGKEGGITGIVNSLIDITELENTNRWLEEAAEMVETLYTNAPAFIGMLRGPEFIYELVNPEYQKLYGKRKLLGRKVFEAVPELEGQGIRETLESVYRTGEAYVVTEKLLYLPRDEGKEPEPVYLNFSYQPIHNVQNEINGILVSGYNVTSQVLARKKNSENLRLILESLPQITSASSADGNNIFFNKFFFEYSGIPKEEANINGWNSILHPSEVESVLSHWERCRETGEDFYRLIQLRRKSDGMYRWHLAHLRALKNEKNEIVQWIGSATDIHEQKIREQKKDEFISIASHEMKTPLTTAKAYMQLLEASLDEADEKARLYISKASRSVEKLTEFVSELLDVNKIQYGKLNFAPSRFDFNDMISEAIEAVHYDTGRHVIIREGYLGEPAEGDRERLQQVVINFLSNAIKYSPDSTEVLISYTASEDEIRLSVKDTGIGIDPMYHKKIFERYFRVEEQEIHFQGLGIGLFISAEIIKKHNGRIWVESEPGRGSTFNFIIPRNHLTL